MTRPFLNTNQMIINYNIEKDIKIATLNLCLGLKFKKLMVEQILNEHNIDIFCMQEVEMRTVMM